MASYVYDIIRSDNTNLYFDSADFDPFPELSEDMILEMLDESAPLIVDSMRGTLKGIIKKQNSGAIKNLKAFKARKRKNGVYSVFVGTNGRTNNFYYNNGRKVPVYHDDALKWLEYGREGQSPRPWVEKSTRHAENAVIAKMQSVYDKYMGK